ncbi:VOC family protein [Oceanicella sp. SM1341]|uniref:VOC family protein n=1 Tax=Oceanicella sp. SM1341 TaxID=1548889 RepID=UPI000E518F25|nr:VOC family protein [Oceanicella sp. SM1341]
MTPISVATPPDAAAPGRPPRSAPPPATATGPAPAAPTVSVATCLWFDGTGEEAAALYTALIPGSRITGRVPPAPDAPALLVSFTLAGTPYQALNGGPMFRHGEAASIAVTTPDQAETDRLWDALTADGGSLGRCGWLRDRFGLSWQIVPEALPRLLAAPGPGASARVREAMMAMGRIDIAALEAAAAAEGVA